MVPKEAMKDVKKAKKSTASGRTVVPLDTKSIILIGGMFSRKRTRQPQVIFFIFTEFKLI